MVVFDLWLPIVLAGIATHILSTIAWTVLPHHKPEWQKLPAEDEFMTLMTSRKVPPGQYIFPFSGVGKDAHKGPSDLAQGKCTGMLILWPKQVNMGAAIGLTLCFFLVAAFVVGYLASLGLKTGESFLPVFRFVTTAGLLTHCAGMFPHVFWFRERIAMRLVDGAAYAVATGLIFAFFWP